VIVHRTRDDLGRRPIAEAVSTPGKELQADATVAAARRLFRNDSVRVVPVLDGERYTGAVDRGAIDGAPAGAPVGWFAAPIVPTAIAPTPADDALAELDRTGASRLVVLAANGVTYVGIVCMRSDRRRLCVDAPPDPKPYALATERTAA